MLDDGNPNWKNILNLIPEALHSAVRPELEAWDRGVNSKLEKVRAEYDGLKDYRMFADNGVDSDYIQQALQLAAALKEDPAGIVDKVNELYELGYVPKEQAQRQSSANNNDDYGDDPFMGNDNNVDLMANPEFKTMFETMQKMQKQFEANQTQEQQEKDTAAFSQYLDELDKETEGGIDKDIVTAYMAQGMDGEDAVKAYHSLLARHFPQNNNSENNNQNNQNNENSNSQGEPPVVMGGSSGGSGSGTPGEPIDFGKLKKNDLNTYVEQVLAGVQNSDRQN